MVSSQNESSSSVEVVESLSFVGSVPVVVAVVPSVVLVGSVVDPVTSSLKKGSVVSKSALLLLFEIA